MKLQIGVDLGGTKIEALALEDGRERARRRVATPAGEGYDAIVIAVRDLVESIEHEAGARGTVGVGTPGAISPATGLLKGSNTLCLNGRPLDRDLCAALRREVRVANDADCFALSEAVDGAARGAEIVFGVILGTGVGGGIVTFGRLVRGPSAGTGEWGHNPLPWPADDERPGPACYCGKYGCIETWISGPGLSADHARRTGEQLDARAVVSLSGPALERWLDRAARSLATVINVLDPHVIVVGGGLSNVEALYREVPSRWGRYVFCAPSQGAASQTEGASGGGQVVSRLVPAMHGDSSGVRGAAWLWP